MHNYSKQYTMQQDTTLIGLQAHIKQMQIELDVAHQAIATQHDHIHNIYIDLKEAKDLLDHNLKATNQGIDVSLAFEERLDRNSKELQQLYHEVELLHARLDKADIEDKKPSFIEQIDTNTLNQVCKDLFSLHKIVELLHARLNKAEL